MLVRTVTWHCVWLRCLLPVLMRLICSACWVRIAGFKSPCPGPASLGKVRTGATTSATLKHRQLLFMLPPYVNLCRYLVSVCAVLPSSTPCLYARPVAHPQLVRCSYGLLMRLSTN